MALKDLQINKINTPTYFVLHFFSKILQIFPSLCSFFGSFRTCSDLFGPIRTRSDLFGYIRMPSEAFGYLRKKFKKIALSIVFDKILSCGHKLFVLLQCKIWLKIDNV